MDESKVPIVKLYESKVPIAPPLPPITDLFLTLVPKTVARLPNKVGLVRFEESISVQFPIGTQVCIFNNVYTIGSDNANTCVESPKVIVSKDTLYTIVNDPVGIPEKLELDLEFILEEKTQVVLPKNMVLFQTGSIKLQLLSECRAMLV